MSKTLARAEMWVSHPKELEPAEILDILSNASGLHGEEPYKHFRAYLFARHHIDLDKLATEGTIYSIPNRVLYCWYDEWQDFKDEDRGG